MSMNHITFLSKNDLLSGDNLPQELNDPNLKKVTDVFNVMKSLSIFAPKIDLSA